MKEPATDFCNIFAFWLIWFFGEVIDPMHFEVTSSLEIIKLGPFVFSVELGEADRMFRIRRMKFAVGQRKQWIEQRKRSYELRILEEAP